MVANDDDGCALLCACPPPLQVCDSPFSWQCVVQYIQSPQTINYCRAQQFASLGVPAPTVEQYASLAPLGGGGPLSGPLSQWVPPR